jgi:zinc transporter 1
VISLLVGLWAVKVANQRTNSKQYTYGWQRAETLGALVNGVFLVALCLSIFLEAIQRFVEPQEVSHPKLILIVGSLGLASNIVGLFLFHDHGHGGHSHGGHSHGHDAHSAAEEGHSHDHGVDAHDHAVADESGNIADVLPQNRVAFPSNITQTTQSDRRRSSLSGKKAKRHNRSQSRTYSTLDEIYVHPSSFRNSIIESSRIHDNEADDEDDSDDAAADGHATEQSPLLAKPKSHSHDSHNGHNRTMKKDTHKDHKHNMPKEQKSGGGHGHSHDLNMRGVFLHVLGDALGNIGVIGTALFIWLTDYSWRFYADPTISLIITIIILLSAIPLVKAASRILLQAVPENLSIDDIEEDITSLDGIVSCHHLHVWQLSDTKLVASLHVQVNFDFKGQGSARYMQLARQIRECLHEYSIHSSTIQPEFCLDASHDHSASPSDVSGDEGANRSKNPSLKGGPDACLLECPDSCGNAKQCCEPGTQGGNGSNGGSSA